MNTGFNLLPCPTGTYSGDYGLSAKTQCKFCDPGKFCANLNSTAPTGYCASGFYCLNGSDTATPSGGNKGVAGVCPAGSYCPAGNASSPILCPVGTFKNSSYGGALSACTVCLPGYYCEHTGLSYPSGLCNAGFYCKQGAEVANPPTTDLNYGPCPMGHFCPIGTSSPFKCKAGTYNSLTQQESCFQCPPGYYCVNGSINYSDCPPGYFCPNG